MFKKLSAEINWKMPITCDLEEKFGKLAEDALKKGDTQTWNLYMTACALAMKADGVLIAAIGPNGEYFSSLPDDGNSSVN